MDLGRQTDLALLNSTLIVLSAEQEQVLSGIVKIMDAYGRVMPIIKQGITNEVAATKEAGTLFRGNSTATKLMTNTTKAVGMNSLSLLLTLLPCTCQIEMAWLEAKSTVGRPEPPWLPISCGVQFAPCPFDHSH